MRFLIDEMFSADVAQRLREAGHDAVQIEEIALSGAQDSQVMAAAAAADRVVVTENAADFLPLLDACTADGGTVPPVVIAPKRNLPRGAGALAHHLAQRLSWWAEKNPASYRHVHWLE